MSENVEKLLENVWKTLKEYSEAIANGGDVDMSELDKRVREFCGEVSSLPGEKAKEYDKKMQEIVVHMTKIMKDLQKMKEGVSQKIGAADSRQTAFSAYGSASTLK